MRLGSETFQRKRLFSRRYRRPSSCTNLRQRPASRSHWCQTVSLRNPFPSVSRGRRPVHISVRGCLPAHIVDSGRLLAQICARGMSSLLLSAPKAFFPHTSAPGAVSHAHQISKGRLPSPTHPIARGRLTLLQNLRAIRCLTRGVEGAKRAAPESCFLPEDFPSVACLLLYI